MEETHELYQAPRGRITGRLSGDHSFVAEKTGTGPLHRYRNRNEFQQAKRQRGNENLREKAYITMSGNGYITLTESGRERAENVLERHTILSDWLISIGVSRETALEDACRVEHDLSEESFEAIKKAVRRS